jgi:glutaredoxin
MSSSQTRLRLLTRPECGLCEEMARDLSRLGVSFDTIDIEADAALEAEYGEVIPVLLAHEQEVARAPQTEATLKRALQRYGLVSGGGR